MISDDEKLKLSIKQIPIGVVAAICPWNFPLVLAMSKIAAGLITGNCVIVKPSPFTPYSILRFTELVRDVLPAGVLQALNGDATLGPRLCEHPGIDKISFTGSTATGKRILASVASTLKPVSLELGGNNASIVFPDVDPNIVAPQVAMGAFFNSGQLCVASKRIYVHERIYDKFLEVMKDTVESWKSSPTSSLETGIMVGPVQNKPQYDIVKGLFKDSRDAGHKFATGDQSYESDDKSYLIKPAIVDNPPDDSLVVIGETFGTSLRPLPQSCLIDTKLRDSQSSNTRNNHPGPIVPVLRWSDEEDVLRRANDCLSGLGGTIWSSEVARARKMAARIEAGTVWINSMEIPLPQAHLAGYKESGLGGEWGKEGLLTYCKPQVTHCYKSAVI